MFMMISPGLESDRKAGGQLDEDGLAAAGALVEDDGELPESLDPFDDAAGFSLLLDEPPPSDELPEESPPDEPLLSPPDELFDPPTPDAARLSVL
jgi:hypothetical protein